MNFIVRKRRAPPAVIIVSLIDVLIVLLIFLMVSTTFKQYPAVKLKLPESKQAEQVGGGPVPLIVTVTKEPPHLYVGTKSVTDDELHNELLGRAKANPGLTLALRADTEAPFGQVLKVMDAANAAKIKDIQSFTQPGIKP